VVKVVKKSKEQKQMEQLVEQQKKMLKQQQKAMKQKATATNDLGESNESLFDSKKTAKKKVVKVVKKSKEQKQMERLVEQQKKMLKQFNRSNNRRHQIRTNATRILGRVTIGWQAYLLLKRPRQTPPQRVTRQEAKMNCLFGCLMQTKLRSSALRRPNSAFWTQ